MKPSFEDLDAQRADGGPALGMLEIDGIAAGYAAADRVVKAAAVRLLLCRPASPGKHLVIFAGEVSDVISSLRAGTEGLPSEPLDSLLLPQADPGVIEALSGPRAGARIDAAGVVECTAVATLLIAADVAVKTARVELLRIQAAMGLGGHAFFVCAGEVSQVRAAVTAAAGFARSRGRLRGEVVLAQPHRDLDPWLAS